MRVSSTYRNVSVKAVRRVWASLSRGVRHERALMAATRVRSRWQLYAALRKLEDIGYIRREAGACGAIVVVVPFIVGPIKTQKPTAGALSTARESTSARR